MAATPTHTLVQRKAAPLQTGRIRPLVKEDLPGVVDLYLRTFPQGRQYSRQRLQDRFGKVLLQNPWYDRSIPSLVYENLGKVLGFLGVVVRPMLLGSEPIRLAACNHFMVDPSARATKAGFDLLRHHFAGPQDLSVAESGDASRKMWEALGGQTSVGRSLHWTRILRPACYGLHQLEKRSSRPGPLRLARPICKLADSIAARLKGNPLYQSAQAEGEELDEQKFIEGLARCAKPAALSPHYDSDSLRWLLWLLADKRELGKLHKAAVRGERGETIGWYIYYLAPGGVSTVLHFHASPTFLPRVLSHLCQHAGSQGSIALSGRLEPRYAKLLSENHCWFRWRSWMLVHSRNPKLVEALDHKDTVFSALEGEFWISVEGESPDCRS